MDLDDYQTTYLLYAPAKNPAGWNLDLAAFGAALDAAFHDVRYETEQGRQLRLCFWAVTEDGIVFDGFATNEGRDTVLLTDNTPGEAAVFIAWLRDSFLPSPDLIRFTTEPAVERGIETDWRVPATADTASIAEELKHHIQVVEG
ncbi:hypothetical protein AQJ66_13670 [Streptomyces bungoensis]|uniref:Uncharacterized protein n=1 Tax=Streptomyces bungoensis TaxID=285568 RepID=A0A101T4I3_9ACTN|nr:hypothetical protein [Streptomyces bungoensis]KUN85551.1 hypothetical protein AQJ66_13670 [Streptomyces bungoensis]